MDPTIITTLISTLGGGIMGLLAGEGEDAQNQAQIDAQLKSAAERLGFDYNELAEKRRQFNQNAQLELDKFLESKGLNRAQLKADIEKSMRDYEVQKEGLGLQKEKQNTDKAFGVADRFSALGDKMAKTDTARRMAAAKPPAPSGRPTMAVAPTAMPSPTANAGAQALAGQQSKTSNKQLFPLTGAI